MYSNSIVIGLVTSLIVRLPSTMMFSDLVMQGYRSDDLEALDKFIEGLTSAMQALTKLIHDQAKMVETAVVLKNIGGNN